MTDEAVWVPGAIAIATIATRVRPSPFLKPKPSAAEIEEAKRNRATGLLRGALIHGVVVARHVGGEIIECEEWRFGFRLHPDGCADDPFKGPEVWPVEIDTTNLGKVQEPELQSLGLPPDRPLDPSAEVLKAFLASLPGMVEGQHTAPALDESARQFVKRSDATKPLPSIPPSRPERLPDDETCRIGDPFSRCGPPTKTSPATRPHGYASRRSLGSGLGRSDTRRSIHPSRSRSREEAGRPAKELPVIPRNDF